LEDHLGNEESCCEDEEGETEGSERIVIVLDKYHFRYYRIFVNSKVVIWDVGGKRKYRMFGIIELDCDIGRRLIAMGNEGPPLS
jgi:hypothetical protein